MSKVGFLREVQIHHRLTYLLPQVVIVFMLFLSYCNLDIRLVQVIRLFNVVVGPSYLAFEVIH